MAEDGIETPIFKPSPMAPDYKHGLIFEAVSVDEAAKHHLVVDVA